MKLNHRKTTLANGLRILSCTMPHTYSVSVGFYVSAGSRYESADLAGASHFLEHMLFKGTVRRPSPQAIAAAIEGHGGVFNASTGQESTVFWAKMPQPQMELALDVLADMLRSSLIVPEEVEKERRVILEEISASQDVPEELVSLVVNSITWPAHPLGRDVAGTPGSVGAMTKTALHGFMATHYGPQNTVLAVTGDVQHDQIAAVAAQLLGDWQQGTMRSYEPAPPNGNAPQVAVIPRPIEQTHLILHLPGITRRDEQRYALGMLNVVLGEGMSSRLFLEIRERLGLAYALDSYTSFLSDTGVIGVYAAVDPTETQAALAAVTRELVRLRNETLDAETLTIAREFSKGRLLLGMEDTLSVASWYGRQEVLDEEILTVEDVIDRLEAVTAEQIQEIAQRLIQSQGARLAIVGPHAEDQAADFEDILVAGLQNSA
jgi:predicted Zn-dependent peptidase